MSFVKLLTIQIFAFVCVLFVFNCPTAVSAEREMVTDTENCLFCHRYPSIGRYDKTGKRRVFYLNEKKFANSVHGKLRCKNCHIGLNQIPHTDVKKVSCATKCHITEPSTNKEFSHANMINKYTQSVHGGNGSGKPPYPEDLPNCTYCHDNRLYTPLKGLGIDTQAMLNETVGRCAGCHTKKEWADKFYAHFTHRMKKRRTQREIVNLCTSCHGDKEKMARHGLESVDTYKDTFHWKQVKYSVKNAPDCISCHVAAGNSIHQIKPQTDSLSPVHMNNRVQTCSRQNGVQTCHPDATQRFATGRVHAYGVKAELISTTAGEKKQVESDNAVSPLLMKRAKIEIPSDELFNYNIIKLVKLFYKILIAAVIGFMGLHQFLDYLKARKKH
ncbi:MAG: hypothetical protein L3J69_15630 [Desulfobacula sp.]|nr:hypothetical protein [Desulfobacula sp.]